MIEHNIDILIEKLNSNIQWMNLSNLQQDARNRFLNSPKLDLRYLSKDFHMKKHSAVNMKN